MEKSKMMRAIVHPHRPGLAYGNIVWAECDSGSAYYRTSRFSARNGKFPADHPVSPNSLMFGKDGQGGDGPSIVEFRNRGYWASCFPEGDGITWKPLNGQSDEQAIIDIQECFPQLTIQSSQ